MTDLLTDPLTIEEPARISLGTRADPNLMEHLRNVSEQDQSTEAPPLSHQD